MRRLYMTMLFMAGLMMELSGQSWAAVESPEALDVVSAMLSAVRVDSGDVATGNAPSNERTASSAGDRQQPQNLAEIWGAIRDTFEVPFAVEALADDCEGADTAATMVAPFVIDEGETFASAMARFEEASEHRWKFEVIRGIPVLRPNVDALGHGNALDTIVDLNIEKASLWESLCDLARAINRKEPDVHPKSHPLIIYPFSIVMARKPAPVFMKDAMVTVKCDGVSAREALCAILATAGAKFTYSFHCRPEGQYVTVTSYTIAGNPDRGGGRFDKGDLEYWTDENLRTIQAE